MHKRSLLALYTVATTLSLLAVTGCNTVQKGAAAGGALGAGAGALVGNGIPEGTVLGGALIGGAAGTATGGLVGDQFANVTDSDMERELQNLRAQLAAKESELAALQNTAPSAESLAEVGRLRDDLNKAQNDLLAAQQQLDQERLLAMNGDNELSNLKQELANEKGRGTGLQQQVSNLEALNKGLENDLASANSARDAYEAQLAAANGELNKLKGDLQTIEASLKEKDQAVEGLRNELSKLNIQLEETSRGLQLTIVDQLLFKPGQAQLSDTGVDLLTKVADIIKSRFPDRELMIEGHTDASPIVKSGWRSNWELGAGRALTVVHELVDIHGFKPEQLSATTFGEFRPTTSNATDQGRAENRRSVITILPEKAPITRKQIENAGL